MSEIRCIVFTPPELLRALGDFVAIQVAGLPRGSFVRAVPVAPPDPAVVEVQFRSDDGDARQMRLNEMEMRTALISYCLGRRVSIPKASQKWAEFVDGDAMLVIVSGQPDVQHAERAAIVARAKALADGKAD